MRILAIQHGGGQGRELWGAWSHGGSGPGEPTRAVLGAGGQVRGPSRRGRQELGLQARAAGPEAGRPDWERLCRQGASEQEPSRDGGGAGPTAGPLGCSRWGVCKAWNAGEMSGLGALGSGLRALGSVLHALRSELHALGSRLQTLGSRLCTLCSGLQALCSVLWALGSALWALGSVFQALGSVLWALCSRLHTPRSRLWAPCSRLWALGSSSGIPAPGSQFQALCSALWSPDSGLRALRSELWAPGSRLCTLGSGLRAPCSGLLVLGSVLRAPHSRLHALGSQLWGLGSGLRAPGSGPAGVCVSALPPQRGSARVACRGHGAGDGANSKAVYRHLVWTLRPALPLLHHPISYTEEVFVLPKEAN